MNQNSYAGFNCTAKQWLGSLPNGWSVSSLKYRVSVNDEVLPDNTDPDYQIEYADISSVSLGAGIAQTESLPYGDAPSRARRIIRSGDTLVSTVRTYLKAITCVREAPDNLIASTGFAVLRSRGNITPEFLGYAAESAPFVSAVVAQSTGVSYPATNPTDIANLPICFPDIEQQKRVTEFLDEKTAHIDALIRKKEELLKKLAERRLAIITKAVTKGLTPEAPMKDSGISWLGSVPVHWDIMSLRLILRTSSGDFISNEQFAKERSEDTPIPVIGGNGVSAYTDKHNSSENTLVVGRVGAHCGNVHLVSEKCWVTDNALKIRIIREEVAEGYLLYLLRVLRLNDSANKSAQPLITGEMVKSQKVCVPLNKEQLEIVQYIRVFSEEADRVQVKVQEAIDCLKEYRSAIITAAVTGQIKVA